MKKFIVFALLLSLGACSKYSSTGEQVYKTSRNGPGITAPRSLSNDDISHYYDLPSQNQKVQAQVEPPEN